MVNLLVKINSKAFVKWCSYSKSCLRIRP